MLLCFIAISSCFNCSFDGHIENMIYILALYVFVIIMCYRCKINILFTQGKHTMLLLSSGGCLVEVNISTKLKFGNILYGCVRQVGCLIEVTANSGFNVE